MTMHVISKSQERASGPSDLLRDKVLNAYHGCHTHATTDFFFFGWRE